MTAIATDNIYKRLADVQMELKAPRDIKGRFGNARSAEQILEASKPVVHKHGLYLYTSDVISEVGGRNYITATATVVNVDKPDEKVSASASAWENEVSASLDTSQVSGKTSSYAKKYALQNLFAIDDTKDADQVHEDPDIDKQPIKDVQKIMIKNILLESKDIQGEEAILGYIYDNYGMDAKKMTVGDADMIINDLNEDYARRV